MNYINDKTLNILLDYAKNDDNIRAVLMEGSRAFGAVDQYSDYDVVYVTVTSEPYFNGAILPFLKENFGEIAVMQTPDNGDPHNVYTHLVQFSSGVRIDLTFNSLDFLSKIPLESGTVVLFDKDGRLSGTKPPSDADFWLSRPSQTQFSEHCNQFWWCSPYVSKAVFRGQLLHALEILSECIRIEYRTMLTYLAGARNNWEHVNPGKHATNIKQLLPPDEIHYYDALMDSYVQADPRKILSALRALMEKYNTLAATVADLLGYKYDFSEAEKTMKFIQMRFGEL
ncbi:MAG: aminoglycoside 6-adenylyltransferase [Eubacteriales bacterium]|nr:aminoglycoside 6-adenylyltransferase [Eubacteriales bacterium]